jgi:hypothetical protein
MSNFIRVCWGFQPLKNSDCLIAGFFGGKGVIKQLFGIIVDRVSRYLVEPAAFFIFRGQTLWKLIQ